MITPTTTIPPPFEGYSHTVTIITGGWGDQVGRCGRCLHDVLLYSVDCDQKTRGNYFTRNVLSEFHIKTSVIRQLFQFDFRQIRRQSRERDPESILLSYN